VLICLYGYTRQEAREGISKIEADYETNNEATPKGVIQLSTTEVKTKAKRPSKGLAKHNRLVKQEARKNSIPGTVVIKKKKRVVLAS
jgi:ribosomal protein L39E